MTYPPAHRGGGLHSRTPHGADGKAQTTKARQEKEATARWQAEWDTKDTHMAHQGVGTPSHQGLPALFDPMALCGSSAGKKTKENTGQGWSAADFSPAPHQPTCAAYQGSNTRIPHESVAAADSLSESDEDHMAVDKLGKTLHATNRAAMRTLEQPSGWQVPQ